MVIGAAPSIANGIINGIDHVPPILLLRAGRVLGARGFEALRYVVIPAAFPAVVGGLKQGWAFAWRSLMAAELIGGLAGHLGIGQLLNNATQQRRLHRRVRGDDRDPDHRDPRRLARVRHRDRAIRRRYGLIDARSTSCGRSGSNSPVALFDLDLAHHVADFGRLARRRCPSTT